MIRSRAENVSEDTDDGADKLNGSDFDDWLSGKKSASQIGAPVISKDAQSIISGNNNPNILAKEGNIEKLNSAIYTAPELQLEIAASYNKAGGKQDFIDGISELENSGQIRDYLDEIGKIDVSAETLDNFTVGGKTSTKGYIELDNEHTSDLAAIKNARDAERLKLEAIKNDPTKGIGSDDYNIQKNKIAEQSELAGLKASDDFIASEFKDFTEIKITGTNANGTNQFDKIYKDPNTGKFIIVEAKGGASSLGTRKVGVAPNEKVVMQGTKAYFDDILLELKKTNPALADEISDAQNALGGSKVDYLLVHQKFDKTGNLLPTEVSKFKIN